MLALMLAIGLAVAFALPAQQAYADDHGAVKLDSNGAPMQWWGNSTSLNAGAGATDGGVTLSATIYEDGCLVVECANGAQTAQLPSTTSGAQWRSLLPWSPSSGTGATEYMSAVKSVEIADGVTAAGMYGYFLNVEGLESVNRIPDGATNLQTCFRGCTSLVEAPLIPSTVTNMNTCFAGCDSLTQLPAGWAFPSGVTPAAGMFAAGGGYSADNPLETYCDAADYEALSAAIDWSAAGRKLVARGGGEPSVDPVKAGNATQGDVHYAWSYGGNVTYAEGTGYTVTPYTADGVTYVIDTIVVDGTAVELTAEQQAQPYTVASANSSVFATFAYTVNFNSPDNGTLSVARADGTILKSGDIVRGGEVLTITATPADGYETDGDMALTGLAAVDASAGTYRVTAVNGEPTPAIAVTFKQAASAIPAADFCEGSGTAEDPYLIPDAATLKALADAVNAGQPYEGAAFKVTADIDLSSYPSWNPIGMGRYDAELKSIVYDYFMGDFDGAGHTIGGLSVNTAGNRITASGLFGHVSGSTIENLTVSGTVEAGGLAGGIVGDLDGGTVVNCRNEVDVHSSETSAGGIVGGAMGRTDPATHKVVPYDPSTLTGCSNAGTVWCGTTGGAGGIAGILPTGSLVERCVNDGIVKTGGGAYAAGITSASTSTVRECANHGKVTSSGARSCGIALSGTIESCYNTGEVCAQRTNEDHTYIASGIAFSGATISNSYNAGTLTGSADYWNWDHGSTAPFPIAYNRSSQAQLDSAKGSTAENSYWLDTCVGTASSDAWVGTSRTDAQMRDAAFVDTLNAGGSAFKLNRMGYPILSFEEEPPLTYSVTVALGQGMSASGELSQAGLDGQTPMAAVTVAPDTGFEIAEPAIEPADAGVAAALDEATGAWTVSGTPTADVTVTFADAELNELVGYKWYTEAGGASGTSYTVSSGAELKELADIVNGTVPGAYGIERDDFAGKTVTLSADADLSAYADWTPIGAATEHAPLSIGSDAELASAVADHGVVYDTDGNSYSGGPNEAWSAEASYYYLDGGTFAGTFDGAGHEVSGLTIATFGEGYKALFGRNGGTVRDFALSGSIGTEAAPVGGDFKDCLAGAVAYNTGTVSGIASSVSIYPGVGETYAVGGVVGRNDGGTVSQCGFAGTISSDTSVLIYRVGGICGHMLNGGTVTECYNAGDITAWNYKNGMQGVAGIVGSLGVGNSGTPGGTVSWCYNTGTIRNGAGDSGTGGKQGTGGIVGGIDNGNVEHCYATGDVYAPGSAGILIGKVGNGNYEGLYSMYEARAHQQYGTKTDDAGVKYADGSDENADGSIKYGGAAIANAYNPGYTIADSWTKAAADMKAEDFAALLDGGSGKFNLDLSGDDAINGGFPVLAWQGGTPAAAKHTVTFDSAGGTAVAPQLLDDGATATRPDDPERDYHVFAGWTLNGEAYDFATPVTGDITLVAAWDETEARVTISTDPADAAVTVTDAGGAAVAPGSDGAWTLVAGDVYRYAAELDGYYPRNGSFTATDGLALELALEAEGGYDGLLHGGEIISADGRYRLADDATGTITIGTGLDVEIAGTSYDAATGSFSGPVYENLNLAVGDGTALTIRDIRAVMTSIDGDTLSHPSIVDFAGSGTLNVSGSNVLDNPEGYGDYAVIHVGPSADVTLAGDGVLYGYKHAGGAFVGANSGEASGKITFESGTWLIKGSKTGALIGSDATNGAKGGDVVINGGQIYLKAVAQGAAIGTSRLGNAGLDVTVNGGMVQILTDFSGSAIGDGGQHVPGGAGTLTVNGGSLMTIVTPNAFSSWGYGDRAKAEGSLATSANVTAAHGYAMLRFDTSEFAGRDSVSVEVDGKPYYTGAPRYAYVTNETKNPSELDPATLSNWYPNDAQWLIPEGDPYTEPDSAPTAGKSKFAGESALYLWLAPEDHEIVVDGVTYTAAWDGEAGEFTVTEGPADLLALATDVIGALDEVVAAPQASADGSDVADGDAYVSADALQALKDAVEDAKAVLDDPDATQAQAVAAQRALADALADYSAAKATAAVERGALEAAIAAAKAAESGVATSTDGANAGDKAWTTSAEKSALDKAIAAAQAALDDAKATQSGVDAQVKSLSTATSTYNSSKKIWHRIWGKTAPDTMKSIASRFGKANVAIVTTDANYKDALAASALAGKNNAIVLMTKKGSLTAQTKAALQAAGVKTVYLVGSTSDVSASVEKALKSGTGVTKVTRVSGASASAKAIAAAKVGGKKSDTVIIATQNGFEDALSIAPYSYATKSPILYAETNKKLSSATTSFIKSAGYRKAIVVGGPIALPASIDTQLKSAGVTSVTRLAGANSYATSQLIANWSTGQLKNGNHGTYKGKALAYVKFQPNVKMSADRLAVSTGQNWLDALAGAALCGKNRSVLLLADAKTAKSNYTLAPAFCKANKASIKTAAYVFGGTSAVQAKVWDALVASTK